jgi:hypothetical protein
VIEAKVMTVELEVSTVEITVSETRVKSDWIIVRVDTATFQKHFNSFQVLKEVEFVIFKVTIQPKFGSTGLTLDGHGHEVGSKCLHIY